MIEFKLKISLKFGNKSSKWVSKVKRQEKLNHYVFWSTVSGGLKIGRSTVATDQ